MGRRGNGEGSIYYEAHRQRYRAALSTPDGRRVTITAKTREECARKLQGLSADVVLSGG